MTTTTSPTPTTPLLAPAYRWATIGMVALIFLAAFEELAVTTIMPAVTADLDGRQWYAVAFSATLATSVVAMVACGTWADRRGPARPLLSAVGLFVLGLLVSGLARDMAVFVAGRALQGLGAGGLVVAIYVLVAQVYAPVDRPRIFGVFAASWVIPSMIGPTIAGAVAQAWSWHWVFLGVVAFALAALVCILPVVRATPLLDRPVEQGSGRRLVLAAVVALAVVALNLAGQESGALVVLGSLVTVGVVVLAVRPLLPVGTLVLRRGLPAVVALRGMIMATFIVSDVYLPYLLQAQYDVPPWLSGVTLTLGAIGWAVGSQVQGHLGERLSHERGMRVGAWLLLAGVLAVAAVAALRLHPAYAALAWVSAGAGMGLMTARASTYVLGASAVGEQGANSSAMTIADAVGSATAIALGGIVFAAFGTSARLAPFVAAFGFACVLAVVAVLVSRRTTTPAGP